MSEIQQEIRYGGSNFNIEGVRKYTKEGFLERNLPLLHIMPDVPKEDKESELIALWELCGEILGIEKEVPKKKETEIILTDPLKENEINGNEDSMAGQTDL